MIIWMIDDNDVLKLLCFSEKNRQIVQLSKCVQLRDDILMSMQKKLDDLCEQMNCMKDQPQAVVGLSASKIKDFSSRRSSLSSKSDSMCSECWFCDQRRAEMTDFPGNTLVKAASGDEMFTNRHSISNEAEQEERRMSDLSDWASSVTSVADIQLNNLAVEQDTYNLKRECEEKDAAIKELSAFIRSNDVASSKRIEELEEVIRRKSTIITKLRKDLLVLEQKVVNLTRTRRRSFPGPSLEKKQLPTMSDNLLYDMDSPLSSDSDCCTSEKQNTTSSVVETQALVKASENTPLRNSFSCENVTKRNQKTSPLSSDSDCCSITSEKQNTTSSIVVESQVTVKASENTPLRNSFSCENVTKRSQKTAVSKIPSTPSIIKVPVQVPKSRPVSPLKEKSLNQTHSSLNQTHSSASAGLKTNRRRTNSGSKDAASQNKRWM
ncbi:uncharacterized protein [Spinacia oleracea]|uniref:Uncharacterized protein isoform X3 n=1 Tax=Spinacia oleracea TaxID=3562 RepID=A0ABM3QHX4_SPIOL|nr:uncharacterized protein LOC110801928 isoform X3 [Spinacia oleracea]